MIRCKRDNCLKKSYYFEIYNHSNARLWICSALSRRIDIFRFLTNYLFRKFEKLRRAHSLRLTLGKFFASIASYNRCRMIVFMFTYSFRHFFHISFSYYLHVDLELHVTNNDNHIRQIRRKREISCMTSKKESTNDFVDNIDQSCSRRCT